LAEPPVAVVEKIAAKHGTTQIARAYLDFLYSHQGQEIVAQHFFRPRQQSVEVVFASEFPPIAVFTIDELFGGWKKAQGRHFSDNGVFDQIYQAGNQ
jgi:ABC-type sulfate transport system substrate-binding protein